MLKRYFYKSVGVLIFFVAFFLFTALPSLAVDCSYDCTQQQNVCEVSGPNNCYAVSQQCQSQSEYYNADCRTQLDACDMACESQTTQCVQQCEQQQSQAQSQSEPQSQPQSEPAPDTSAAPPAPAPQNQPPTQEQVDRYNANCAGVLEDDTAYHTCLANKTALGQGFAADAKTPSNTVFTAPADKAVPLDIPNGEVRLKAGSSLEYLGDATLNFIKGVFQVVEDSSKTIKEKGVNQFLDETRQTLTEKTEPKWRRIMRQRTVAVAVRGTNFIVDATNDTATNVKVLKGSVALTIQGTKKIVTLKAGQQITASDTGLSKVTKFDVKKLDNWYTQVPPGPAFFASSWLSASNTGTFKRSCETDLSPIDPGNNAITPDQKKVIDAYNAATAVFRLNETESVNSQAHTLYEKIEKHDKQGTRTLEVYVDAKNLYMRGPGVKNWEAFSDPAVIQAMFVSAAKENITAHLDPNFTFSMWFDIPRKAYFMGQMKNDGAAAILAQATGIAFTADQVTSNDVQLDIDEETKSWAGLRYDVTAHSGFDFSAMKPCTLSYGKDVKIAIPKKFKTVSKDVGEKDLVAMVQGMN